MDLTTLNRAHNRSTALRVARAFLFAAFTGVALCAPSSSDASLRVYFGTLHAYTGLSDGLASVTAQDAFRIAREQGELDFLSITDHSEMLSILEMQELRREAEFASDGSFVGIAGQSSGTAELNSINVHNLPIPIPAVLHGKHRSIYGDLMPQFVADRPGEPIVAGFNHPRDLSADYGLDAEFGGDWASFVAIYDPFVQLVAVASGPTDSGQPTYEPDSLDRFLHRDVSVDAWLEYVTRGMHVAPQIDHGTHSGAFGFRVEGRTAVWVDGAFTQLSLMDAISQRHCYATEDRNLHILAFVGDGHLPGDIVRSSPGQTIPVTLHIHDPDEVDASYEINVWSGRTGSGRRARQLGTVHRLYRGGDLRVELAGEPGHYYVIHLRQQSTDAPCGAPDDVWLAPIWVEAGCPTDSEREAWAFVARKGSNTYHTPQCDEVADSKVGRFEFYAAAPLGMHAHEECVPSRHGSRSHAAENVGVNDQR